MSEFYQNINPYYEKVKSPNSSSSSTTSRNRHFDDHQVPLNIVEEVNETDENITEGAYRSKTPNINLMASKHSYIHNQDYLLKGQESQSYNPSHYYNMEQKYNNNHYKSTQKRKRTPPYAYERPVKQYLNQLKDCNKRLEETMEQLNQNMRTGATNNDMHISSLPKIRMSETPKLDRDQYRDRKDQQNYFMSDNIKEQLLIEKIQKEIIIDKNQDSKHKNYKDSNPEAQIYYTPRDITPKRVAPLIINDYLPISENNYEDHKHPREKLFQKQYQIMQQELMETKRKLEYQERRSSQPNVNARYLQPNPLDNYQKPIQQTQTYTKKFDEINSSSQYINTPHIGDINELEYDIQKRSASVDPRSKHAKSSQSQKNNQNNRINKQQKKKKSKQEMEDEEDTILETKPDPQYKLYMPVSISRINQQYKSSSMENLPNDIIKSEVTQSQYINSPESPDKYKGPVEVAQPDFKQINLKQSYLNQNNQQNNNKLQSKVVSSNNNKSKGSDQTSTSGSNNSKIKSNQSRNDRDLELPNQSGLGMTDDEFDYNNFEYKKQNLKNSKHIVNGNQIAIVTNTNNQLTENIDFDNNYQFSTQSNKQTVNPQQIKNASKEVQTTKFDNKYINQMNEYSQTQDFPTRMNSQPEISTPLPPFYSQQNKNIRSNSSQQTENSNRNYEPQQQIQMGQPIIPINNYYQTRQTPDINSANQYDQFTNQKPFFNNSFNIEMEQDQGRQMRSSSLQPQKNNQNGSNNQIKQGYASEGQPDEEIQMKHFIQLDTYGKNDVKNYKQSRNSNQNSQVNSNISKQYSFSKQQDMQQQQSKTQNNYLNPKQKAYTSKSRSSQDRKNKNGAEVKDFVSPSVYEKLYSEAFRINTNTLEKKKNRNILANKNVQCPVCFENLSINNINHECGGSDPQIMKNQLPIQ